MSRKQGQQTQDFRPQANQIVLTFDLGAGGASGALAEKGEEAGDGDAYHRALFKKLREVAGAVDLPVATLAMLACHWGIDKAVAKATIEYEESQARRRRAWEDGSPTQEAGGEPKAGGPEASKAGAVEPKPGGRAA